MAPHFSPPTGGVKRRSYDVDPHPPCQAPPTAHFPPPPATGGFGRRSHDDEAHSRAPQPPPFPKSDHPRTPPPPPNPPPPAALSSGGAMTTNLTPEVVLFPLPRPAASSGGVVIPIPVPILGEIHAQGLSHAYIFQKEAMLIHKKDKEEPVINTDTQSLEYLEDTSMPQDYEHMTKAWVGQNRSLGGFQLVSSHIAKYVSHEIVNSEIILFKGHNSEVFSCSWSPAGSILISGSAYSTTLIWRPDCSFASSMKIWPVHVRILRHCVDQTDGQNEDVLILNYHGNGTICAAGSHDGQSRIWSKDDILDLIYKKRIGFWLILRNDLWRHENIGSVRVLRPYQLKMELRMFRFSDVCCS